MTYDIYRLNNLTNKSIFFLLICFQIMNPGYSQKVSSGDEAGLERTLYLFEPDTVDSAEWAMIAQKDALGSPLPLITLSSNDFLEIKKLEGNRYDVLVQGSFRGNLYWEHRLLEYRERQTAFFFTIDAYGNAGEPIILDGIMGSPEVLAKPSGNFSLLVWEHVDQTTLQLYEWTINSRDDYKRRRTAVPAETAFPAIMFQTGQTNPPQAAPFLELPIDNPEDPEG